MFNIRNKSFFIHLTTQCKFFLLFYFPILKNIIIRCLVAQSCRTLLILFYFLTYTPFTLFFTTTTAVAAADFRVIGWIQQICYTVKSAYYQVCFIYRNSLQPYCIYTFIDNSFIRKIYRISLAVCIQSSIFYTNLRFFVDQTFEEKHNMNE